MFDIINECINDYIKLFFIGSRFPVALLYNDGTVVNLECDPFECDPFMEITYE